MDVRVLGGGALVVAAVVVVVMALFGTTVEVPVLGGLETLAFPLIVVGALVVVSGRRASRSRSACSHDVPPGALHVPEVRRHRDDDGDRSHSGDDGGGGYDGGGGGGD